MNPSPQESREAVLRVLAEVDREHEAAYAVISKAVSMCISSGMGRKETAKFLGVSPWRIDSSGRYFRSLRATRNLLHNALAAGGVDPDSVADIVGRAWNAEKSLQRMDHI